jgi:hypothetical protein
VTSIVAPRIVFFLCDNSDEDVVKEDGEESPDGAVEAAEAEEKEEEVGEGSPEDGEGSPEYGEKSPEDGEESPEDGEGSPEYGEKSPEDAVEDIEDGESKTLSIHIIKYKSWLASALPSAFCPRAFCQTCLLPNVLSA